MQDVSLPSENQIVADPVRLNLEAIKATLEKVEADWEQIDTQLINTGVGKKDIPFNKLIKENMLNAYAYLDGLLEQKIAPFSQESLGPMLGLNSMVLYGQNHALMLEYGNAVEVNTVKFYDQIDTLIKWYQKHEGKSKTRKLAGEIYVTILGHPQLFIEGNHRSGSLIASWINCYNGYPPFVLSPENALAFFQPSSEIKKFVNKSSWRGLTKLPKYRKSFGALWETLTSHREYIR